MIGGRLLSLAFPKRPPATDAISGLPTARDRQAHDAMVDWILARWGDGAETITDEDLRQAGFTAEQVARLWDAAYCAAVARRSVREVMP